jgi:hypothetical protein
MKDNFGFGTKPSMKEVPPGAEATFTFVGEPELVETEWGEKYSFPINLISHSSYDTLPLKMTWQSKCQSAKQLFTGLNDPSYSLHKELKKHFKESAWTLTRFDTGAYWLEVQQ